MKRCIYSFALGLATWFAPATLLAVAPDGYYNSLNGKSGVELRKAVAKVSIPENFVSIEFGDGNTSFKTWQAFNTTDVHLVEGKEVWWDMYSNNLVYVATGNKSLNIEHAVPNSWWGGKAGDLQAYQDLFNLNPSNSDANSKKSNNPMGCVIAKPEYDNGLSKVGSPASGYGGGASKLFEPADEYKGDFARAYFYMFAAYPDIPWRTDKGGEKMYVISENGLMLQDWALKMLLKWNEEDPVDNKEMNRNDAIYNCQKNRNPFIDMPQLAEYIWGSKSNENFDPEKMKGDVFDRPESPKPKGMWLTAVDNYQFRNWAAMDVEFQTGGNDLWISYNGGKYQRYGTAISIPNASSQGTIYTLSAYCEAVNGRYTLASPITTVTLIGKDPTVSDYSSARYLPVKKGENISLNDKYLITDALNKHVMGIEGATFMPDCWFARMEGDEMVEIPQKSALVEFVPASTGYYNLRLSDIRGDVKGYWNANGKNKKKIDASTPTPAKVEIGEDGIVTIEFTQNGSLQYNQTQPRFLNYSSSQGAVKLYRFKEFLSGNYSDVEDLFCDDYNEFPKVEGSNIIAPEGSTIYNIQGIKTGWNALDKGVYIVVSPKGKRYKIMVN